MKGAFRPGWKELDDEASSICFTACSNTYCEKLKVCNEIKLRHFNKGDEAVQLCKTVGWSPSVEREVVESNVDKKNSLFIHFHCTFHIPCIHLAHFSYSSI